MLDLDHSPIFADPAVLTRPDLLTSFRSTGVAVLGPPALSEPVHAALCVEANRQMDEASWQLTGTRTHGEIEQVNQRAHLGPIARAYLSSDAVLTWLYTLTGERLAPSWSATCYTRYLGAANGQGEHMGEHCDKADLCKYNLLSYCQARWPTGAEPSPGMQLLVFRGDNSSTGLSTRITARPNRVSALFGSRHAHMRPPLAFGESLTMLAGCYRVA